jgi:hypothetical protein
MLHLLHLLHLLARTPRTGLGNCKSHPRTPPPPAALNPPTLHHPRPLPPLLQPPSSLSLSHSHITHHTSHITTTHHTSQDIAFATSRSVVDKLLRVDLLCMKPPTQRDVKVRCGAARRGAVRRVPVRFVCPESSLARRDASG